MTSVGADMPVQINRCRALLKQCEEMRGTPGVNMEFMIANLDQAITEAVDAQGSGDVVRILRAYENLKGFES